MERIAGISEKTEPEFVWKPVDTFLFHYRLSVV